MPSSFYHFIATSNSSSSFRTTSPSHPPGFPILSFLSLSCQMNVTQHAVIVRRTTTWTTQDKCTAILKPQLFKTRSSGALRAPTSSLRLFGPPLALRASFWPFGFLDFSGFFGFFGLFRIFQDFWYFLDFQDFWYFRGF